MRLNNLNYGYERVKMESDNIFSLLPQQLNKEIFDVLLQDKKIRIERIVSTGQTSPETGWYDQSENEWVIVLKGEAVVVFEDKEITMSVGSYINIPAHTKHKVSWTHPKLETIWLAVHY